MHLDRALEKFTTQLAGDGRAEATIAQYTRHVRTLSRWLQAENRSCEIQTLDHEVLAKFLASPLARERYDGRAKRPRSGNALRSSLRCLFGYLHAAGYLRETPARLIRQARCTPPPPRALSEPERDRLLDVLASAKGPLAARDRALFDKLRDHLFRVDDFVACVRCRRRFEIPSHQTMIFIERGREGAGPVDVDDDNFGNR